MDVDRERVLAYILYVIVFAIPIGLIVISWYLILSMMALGGIDVK